mgnify:CR=1 FL=1
MKVVDCKTCNGKGRLWYPGCGDTDTACDDCDGVGQVLKKKQEKA